MKTICLLCGLLAVSGLTPLLAQGCTSNTTFTYKTINSTGDWMTSGNWSASPNPATLSAASDANYAPHTYTFQGTPYANSVVIPSGDVVLVISSNFALHNANLVVKGSLTFDGGKLNLDAGYGIIVESGGTVCCATGGTCNASDVISIGASNVWGGGGGSTGTVTGPTSCVSSCTVLPIIMTAFSAKANQSSVTLSWTTASELNFDYFSLQRSPDGTSFKEIAQIKGNGTTSQMHTYAYEDEDPIIGRSYYRFTSVDFDNYQQTFKVLSVDYQGEKRFYVTPNPSDGSTLGLGFNFANDADAQVIIYDNLGSVIGTYRVAGSSTINVDTTLKSGVYLAKYSSSTFTRTERFIVR